MSRKVIILNSARHEFGEIKNYVLTQFGTAVWNGVFEEFRATIDNIGLYPSAGTEILELKELGQDNFRIRLVRQTRIVYEYDDKEVLIHMFIHTMRDCRTHLLKRLFNA